MGVVVFLSLPSWADIDRSHTVESNFREIAGIINPDSRWTDYQRTRWRKSDVEQRAFIASPLKT